MNDKKRAVIILGEDINKHTIRTLNYMQKHFNWEFFIVYWESEFISHSYLIQFFDLDKILVLKRIRFPWFNNNQNQIETFLSQIKTNLSVFIGNFDNNLIKDISINNFHRILIGSFERYVFKFDKIIKDSFVVKITNSNIDEVPYPRIDYQDFLDFDTNEVLKIRQDNNLISYKSGIISRKFVVGFLSDMDSFEGIRTVIKEEDYKYINLNNFLDSDIKLINIEDYNAPIWFEIMDMLIVSQVLSQRILKYILWAMASGTILILPRTDDMISFAGKGAIYYKENSTSELRACLQVLELSNKKIQELRENSMKTIQRRFTYKSISESWNDIFEKVCFI